MKVGGSATSQETTNYFMSILHERMSWSRSSMVNISRKASQSQRPTIGDSSLKPVSSSIYGVRPVVKEFPFLCETTIWHMGSAYQQEVRIAGLGDGDETLHAEGYDVVER